MFNTASNRTKDNLKHVHYKLIMLVGYALAISEQDFFVNEGLRTAEKQLEYFNKGVSQIDGIHKIGRHQDNPDTPEIDGRAVDVYFTGWNNKIPITDERWKKVHDAFRKASENLRIKIIFGADWKTFKDYPHIELDKSEW